MARRLPSAGKWNRQRDTVGVPVADVIIKRRATSFIDTPTGVVPVRRVWSTGRVSFTPTLPLN